MRTGREIYEAVLEELNRSNTMSMEPNEFNHHAKVGMLEWIKLRYWAFDQHQKSIDDLDPIIVISNPMFPVYTVQGAERWETPSALLYLLRVKMEQEYQGDNCFPDGYKLPFQAARYRTHNLGNNAYNKPSPKQLYYLQAGGQLIRIGEPNATTKVTNAIIHYLRYPVFPSVDSSGESASNSEFGIMQNMEIVKWITASYLEKIESLRTQSQLAIQGQVFTHQTNLTTKN